MHRPVARRISRGGRGDPPRPRSDATMSARTRRGRRAFTPSMGDGGAIRLERRDLMAQVPIATHRLDKLIPDWWKAPGQFRTYLQDDRGKVYPVSTSRDLRKAFEEMRAAGRTIGILAIKGHGGEELIQMSKEDLDSLYCKDGTILLHGEESTKLMQSVCGPNSLVYFTGCETVPLAPDVSK